MKVTLGGDRLGSGNKNKIALRNYERSTHNLSQKWTSSMTVGALYPFLVLPAMRGDKFEIDLAAAARTIPTQGPLFGSFKMQLDVFQCPVRLYQAILHNNPTNIGLQMDNVKFPKIVCHTTAYKDEIYKGMEFNNSCLMKYLGISGIARHITNAGDADKYDTARFFNALPLLSYYDIFKNYYSNKQEEKAYVIAPKTSTIYAYPSKYLWNDSFYTGRRAWRTLSNTDKKFIVGIEFEEPVYFDEVKSTALVQFAGTDVNGSYVYSEFPPTEIASQLDGIGGTTYVTTDNDEQQIFDDISNTTKSRKWLFTFESQADFATFVKEDLFQDLENSPYDVQWIATHETYPYSTTTELSLSSFPLKNIDDMRMKLLSWNNIGSDFQINFGASEAGNIWNEQSGTDGTGLPYITNSAKIENGDTLNKFALNGLVIKTYQSDIFNNWIQTEWIDGENGIAAITAIDTSDGNFSIDTLNLSEKLYNMLNRIAVSGGTYEDWQDAVWMESPKRHMESPIYLGGMSNEVVFEEIIQSAPTEGSPLGTLGGRGVLVKRKGGKINVKVDEASFIIGIVSLTPRLNYSQGNEWYMTELDTMDDLHKPALDGIGFQNLMAEQLAWFGTSKANDGTTRRDIVGKVPAWINYMTAVDKVYGDLAEGENSFMVLNRNYEKKQTSGGGIADITTYIDPTKYNYAFAVKTLDAQNFWVQIYCDIKARRLMSAKQIPNI